MVIALLAIAIGAMILSGLVTIYIDVPRQMGAQFRSYGANMLFTASGETISEKDVEEAAVNYAAYQYAMYGMGNVPAEILNDAAKRMLSDENQRRRLEEQVEDNKAFQAVRENVTLQNKKISEEKFRELK